MIRRGARDASERRSGIGEDERQPKMMQLALGESVPVWLSW